MTDDLVISTVGQEAIEALTEIMETSFDPQYGEAWSRAQCLGIFALPGVWLGLAVTDGLPAGFALGRSVLDEAELLLIAVRPDLRGRGIGCQLVNHTISTAIERGASKLHLEVREGNDAMQLYQRAGFKLVGRRHGYYRGTSGRSFDALTLLLDLGEKFTA